jgi:prefoldin subunit 5
VSPMRFTVQIALPNVLNRKTSQKIEQLEKKNEQLEKNLEQLNERLKQMTLQQKSAIDPQMDVISQPK